MTSVRARRKLGAALALALVAAVTACGSPAPSGAGVNPSDAIQKRLQERLRRDLVSPELLARYRSRVLAEGDALVRIQIPKLGVDTVAVEGTDNHALDAGSGHYPQTPLPCETGNVAFAGHRDTYGEVFAGLDRLVAGDQIILTTPVGACTYEVTGEPYIVAAKNFAPIANNPQNSSLTLTTTDKADPTGKRLIVKAAGAATTSSSASVAVQAAQRHG